TACLARSPAWSMAPSAPVSTVVLSLGPWVRLALLPVVTNSFRTLSASASVVAGTTAFSPCTVRQPDTPVSPVSTATSTATALNPRALVRTLLDPSRTGFSGPNPTGVRPGPDAGPALPATAARGRGGGEGRPSS